MIGKVDCPRKQAAVGYEETQMHKSLYINPDKCTGCLQCEMACSYENYGVFNPAKSRIKVVRFSSLGAQGSV